MSRVERCLCVSEKNGAGLCWDNGGDDACTGVMTRPYQQCDVVSADGAEVAGAGVKVHGGGVQASAREN